MMPPERRVANAWVQSIRLLDGQITKNTVSGKTDIIRPSAKFTIFATYSQTPEYMLIHNDNGN